MNYYFAGSHMKEIDEYMIKKGCRRLMSYHYQKDRDVQHWIENGGNPLFIDSGAFSAHTSGAEIAVDEYIEFLNDYDEHIEICAQLDTIPGEFGKPKTPGQLQEAAEQSWNNYLYMYDKLKSPKKLLPVFHQGEDFKFLKQILEHEPKVEYMGISPANDLSQNRKNPWIMKCFKIIRESNNPDIKTHALGMTSLPALKRMPFYSADSTAWLSGGRAGTILTKFGMMHISDNGKSKFNHVINLSEQKRKIVEEEIEKRGYTLEGLMNEYKDRLKWNIDFLVDWYDDYEYQPKKTNQNRLL